MQINTSKNSATRKTTGLSWLQVIQKFTSGTRNNLSIFVARISIYKATCAVALKIALVCVLALFVGLYSSVKASSFPEWAQPLTDQHESYHPSAMEIVRWIDFNAHEVDADRPNQVVKFTPAVSSNGKTVADKRPDQNPRQSYQGSVICSENHIFVLKVFLLCLMIGVLLGYLATIFWDWFSYSPAIESIYNYICDVIDKIKHQAADGNISKKKNILPAIILCVIIQVGISVHGNAEASMGLPGTHFIAKSSFMGAAKNIFITETAITKNCGLAEIGFIYFSGANRLLKNDFHEYLS